jgi:hypothetical protein
MASPLGTSQQKQKKDIKKEKKAIPVTGRGGFKVVRS